MRFFKETHVDFIGYRYIAFIASMTVIVVGLVSLAIKGGPDMSIDFEGGTLVQMRFDKPVPITELRTIVAGAGYGSGDIQEFGEAHEFIITLEKISESEHAGKILLEALAKAAPTGKWTLVSVKEMPPNLSEGFEGGTLVVVKGESIPPIEELKNRVRESGVGFMEATKETAGTVAFSIPFLGIESQAAETIKEAVMKAYPERTIEIRRTETVGPKIGEELKNKMWAAVIISMFGIIIYISWRFEFKFGVGAVLALAHDVLITLGIFSLLNKEISMVVIAAILTIVGYSINDTIVIFDRIRENFNLRRRESYESMINISINETLSRTINTSLTTLIVVIFLFFFGGEVIHDFAFALIIGIVVGTYSSIYVASPLVIEWEHRITNRIKPKMKV